MVEIPVEKKGGIPWWVWLLAALLLAALLWWLLDNDREAREPVETAGYEQVAEPQAGDPAAVAIVGTDPATTNQAAGQGAAAGAITSLATIAGASSPNEVVGRSVELQRVPVAEMVSDAGFYVGSGSTDRVYVLLNEQRTPNTPIEGRVNVNKGQTVNLSGTVRSAADVDQGLVMPAGVDRYIWAETVQVQ